MKALLDLNRDGLVNVVAVVMTALASAVLCNKSEWDWFECLLAVLNLLLLVANTFFVFRFMTQRTEGA